MERQANRGSDADDARATEGTSHRGHDQPHQGQRDRNREGGVRQPVVDEGRRIVDAASRHPAKPSARVCNVTGGSVVSANGAGGEAHASGATSTMISWSTVRITTLALLVTTVFTTVFAATA